MTTTTVNEELAPHRPGPDARTLAAMAPWIAERELERRRLLDAGDPAGETYPHMGEIYPKSRQYELAFVRAGGLLAAGVDPAFGALPGFGDQRNLELLVEAGFTVPEAVQVITANGARMLGVAAELGHHRAGQDCRPAGDSGRPDPGPHRDSADGDRLQRRRRLRLGQADRERAGPGRDPLRPVRAWRRPGATRRSARSRTRPGRRPGRSAGGRPPARSPIPDRRRCCSWAPATGRPPT